MSELRIIPVVFGGKHFIITDHRMQYDYGQVLDFKDLELSDSFEARFSNSPVGESVGQIGTNNRIRIPKQFFESGEPIYCYITLHDEVTDGRTVYTTKVPIKPSTERTEEEPEPEEESLITQAITALNNAVDVTSQKAQEASDSADRAEQAAEGTEGYAERAEAAQNASEDARDIALEAKVSAQASAATASEKASEAISSATTASQFAVDASVRAHNASEYAQTASTKASEASQSASTASQKAQEASESADRAEHAAEDVEGYAERAEAAQSASESARDRATQAETSARTSAATASEKASEAISSAATASQSALTAENASESAQEYATASAESASQASQSADTASESASASAENALFTAGKALDASNSASEAAQSASTAVQAKTDAETAKTASETAQGLAEQAQTAAETAQGAAEDARDEAQEIVDGISGKVEQIDSNTERIESLEDDRYKPYPIDSSSGSIASFPDGADGIPLKSCIVQIEPVQDLHGYDSPWPSGGGKNKINVPDVTLSGNSYIFNLTNLSIPAGTYTFSMDTTAVTTPSFAVSGANGDYLNTSIPNPFTFTVDGEITGIRCYSAAGTYSKIMLEAGSTKTSYAPYSNICPITGWTGCDVQRTGKNLFDGVIESGDYDVTASAGGRKRSSADRMRCANFIPVKPNTTYYSKMPYLNSIVVFYDEEKWMHSNGYALARNTTFTTPSWCKYITFYYVDTQYNNDISINYPATDTEYHDYKPSATYPITFPSEAGTVYGGYVDVLNGELVVDRATRTLNGTEPGWNINANPDHPKRTYAYNKNASMGEILTTTEIISSYVPSAIFKGNDEVEGIYVDAGYLWIRTAPMVEMTALVNWTTYLSNNPLQVVYKLAEPIHYPLTPNQINSLYGQNNIWADTGDTEVTYRADTTLYISRLTEPDADMVADANIVSGQYFMVGNNLYRATANIASGASVIMGTNATKVSLAQALNEINA